MRTPSIGRTVIVVGHRSNGTNIHPAVITRVWGTNPGDLINVHVFPDYAPSFQATSIPLYESRSDVPEHTPLAAYWPEVV